jgi:hypothetical protein
MQERTRPDSCARMVFNLLTSLDTYGSYIDPTPVCGARGSGWGSGLFVIMMMMMFITPPKP